MNFIIDTQGETNIKEKRPLIDSDDEFDIENFDESSLKETRKTFKKSSEVTFESFDTFMGWTEAPKKKKSLVPDSSAPASSAPASPAPPASKSSEKEVNELLKKAVVRPGFEQLETVPRYEVSKKRQALERKKEREKTKGSKWFNMSAPEMTPEIKHDLQVIQMRSVLDPKHFYKKNDTKALPKYFQIGKVVDSPLDYYSGRLTSKERKKTLVDELMADAQFNKYNKDKYKEIVKKSAVGLRKAHAHAKRIKKRK